MGLDRQEKYDHLMAVYIPPVPMEQRTRYDMDDLVVSRPIFVWRMPVGSGADLRGSFCLIAGESYEYIQAVREDDPDHMYDELGDVL